MRETEIIQKAKKGDRSAQSELYTAFYKKVYYLALKMTGNREDAEDIVQDSFMAAFRALPNLEKDEAFAKWLMQIVANRCRNRIGQQKYTTGLPGGFEDYEPDPNEGCCRKMSCRTRQSAISFWASCAPCPRPSGNASCCFIIPK